MSWLPPVLFWTLAAAHLGIAVLLMVNRAYLRRQKRNLAPLADHPRVSVLIPARNEADNLRRLLPTLLTQRYPDFEVIVYDDASTDGTGTVARQFADDRLRVLDGDGPPPGWVGKVHALYQATRHAEGDRFLFLDADAALADPDALERLVARHAALPGDGVLTGLNQLRGGGLLLVSLVPFAVLAGLPLPLVPRTRSASLSALNGQCWLIDAALYRRLEPHDHVRAEVLEDVQIGRYLKRNGVTPHLLDLQDDLAIWMYTDLPDAWQGFRKNAYLLMSGTPAAFVALWLLFVALYVLAPLGALALLASTILLKGLADRFGGFPLWVTLLAPLSFLLASVLQLHSAVSHWTGRVAWKGRRV